MGIPGTFVGSEQQTDLVSSTWFGPVTSISYQRSISVVPRLNDLNVKTTMDPKAVLLSAAIVDTTRVIIGTKWSYTRVLSQQCTGQVILMIKRLE